jgi:hypothetical protein
MKRLTVGFGALLLLASCSSDPDYGKTGVSAEAASHDLAECKAQAQAVVRRDTAIDTDILASRSGDWQRTGTMEVRQSSMRASNSARYSATLDRCMAAKGYSRQ